MKTFLESKNSPYSAITSRANSVLVPEKSIQGIEKSSQEKILQEDHRMMPLPNLKERGHWHVHRGDSQKEG